MTKSKILNLKSQSERPRLVVRKSLRGLTVQVINADGTVVAGTWGLKKKTVAIAERVAKQAIENKVKSVRFDRGKHRYHGIVKLAAEAARKAGLEF